MAEKDSSRTKMMDAMPDNMMSRLARKASRMADKVGFTQEDKYAGKTKEDMAVKKAKGGAIKYKSGGVTRADGACTKGHTKGKMV